MNRVLTETIREKVLDLGMDLVGFAPVSRWKHAPYLLSPQAILPESKTVVVGAIHITDTWTEMGGTPEPQDRSPGGWMDQNSLLDRVAYNISRLLEDYGHKAIGVASSNIWRYRAYEGIPSLFAPDLSHIHAAAAAGLAEIGWSGLAITPEFGSRCRFISIVTDAELEPTPMYSGPPLCDMCMECVKYCPTGSLKKELGEPHVCKIGNKTYKYANKNMWRCAWAEHFNLDLNSENLKKWDKITEKEIMQEMTENGVRGHERGVCQKVCVPPHLRSKEQSFGRNWQIAQNRINKRYPDSMPTLRKMRDDISAYAKKLGMDLVSVGPLNPESEAGKLALSDAPGMRNVIGFAMRIPENGKAKNKRQPLTFDGWWYGTYNLMHHCCLKVARMVEDYGYHAASYTGSIHEPEGNEKQQLAAMAGIGNFDKDGKFVTPEFGSEVVVGAVTTDAPVDATTHKDAPVTLAAKPKLTGKKLRFEVEKLAQENLVSSLGVAPVDIFDNIVEDLKANVDEKKLGEYVVDGAKLTYHGPYESEIKFEEKKITHPSDLVPGAKSVIVMGMHLQPELIANAGLEKSKQIGTYGFHQYQTSHELSIAAYEVARMLTEMGYKVDITTDMLGVGSMVNTPRGLHPDARCNAIEAVAAGLGEIGKSGALLTEEHGPHQRRFVIVTDAELPIDQPSLDQQLCKNCDKCAETCPMQVIENKSFTVRVGDAEIQVPEIERHRCDWSKRYALCKDEGPELIGNITNVKPPEGRDITIEDIAEASKEKDPIMKSRTCILETCLRQCPAGI